MIYLKATADDFDLDVVDSRGYPRRRLMQSEHPADAQLRAPVIFHTCRQIREEGLPFYYQKRTFYFKVYHHKWDLTEKWLNAIGPAACQNVRLVNIWVFRCVYRLLRDLPPALDRDLHVNYYPDIANNGS